MASKRRHFAPAGRKSWDSVTDTNETNIDQRFIALVKARDYDDAIALLTLVTDINVRDPDLGATALHFAAARSATQLLVELEKHPDLDYAARDKRGYRPCDCAWSDGQNEQLGSELAQKELAQAQARGFAPDDPSTT